MGQQLEIVIKVTKYCNLRCSYCYEYSDLNKKDRMSLDSITSLFRNIGGDLVENQYESLYFIWHGGEPFLIPLDYYDAIRPLQRDILDHKVRFSNGIQTNLTVLTNRHVRYLRSGMFFSNLGVSIDLYGDQRVDMRGRPSTQVALANMQRLLAEGISFSAIAVLARSTLPKVRDIFRFFDQARIGVRFLPFYLSARDPVLASQQVADHALTYDELVGALNIIFDEWLVSKHALSTNPIDEYIEYALAHVGGKGRSPRRTQIESVLIVNTDGGVWGAGSAYSSASKYGNLFQEGLSAILSSPARRLEIERAQDRVHRHCGPCQYYGSCPGHFVADASPQQQLLLEQYGCPVREVIGHILEKFDNIRLREMIERSFSLDSAPAIVHSKMGSSAAAFNDSTLRVATAAIGPDA